MYDISLTCTLYKTYIQTNKVAQCLLLFYILQKIIAVAPFGSWCSFLHLEVPFGGRLVGAMTVPSSTFQLNVRRITKCLICLVHILCFWSIKEGGGGFCTLGRVEDFGHKGYSVFWIL